MLNIRQKLTSFVEDEQGTTLVEFAVCVALFLLIVFAVLDFSRLGYNWVVTEKAMQKAVHLATLRPPMCAGLPLYHRRSAANNDADLYPAGTDCKTSGGICQQVNRPCTIDPADSRFDSGNPAAVATSDEIWAVLEDLLPLGATRSNVMVQYNYDKNLGFVGGPYIPLISATLIGNANGSGCGNQQVRLSDGSTVTQPAFCFEFITPLSALAASIGVDDADEVPGEGGIATIPFPAVNVTLPAEDMNQGNRG